MMKRRRRSLMLKPFSVALLLLAAITPFAKAQFTMQEARAAYPLNMEKVTKTYQAAIELARLIASDSGLNRQLQSGGQDTLKAQIHTFESTPKVSKIISSHGITVRDYCMTTIAINTGLSPVAGSKSSEEPVDIAASPEHVKFVHDHLNEIRDFKEQVLKAHREGAKSN
jgi:hypothetical protein